MFKVLFVGENSKPFKDLLRDFIWREIPWRDGLEELFVEEAPDLALLEVHDVQGASRLVKDIKAYGRERPVPIVLVGGQELLRERELLLQVEDFLTEPFDPPEAKIRLERVLKRAYSVEGQGRIRSADLVIELSRREVTLAGKPLALTFKEYELLKFLAANRGRVFSREALLNKVWGYDYYGGERTVDVHIRRLRAKIEVGGRTFIETVRGVGYRFKER